MSKKNLFYFTVTISLIFLSACSNPLGGEKSKIDSTYGASPASSVTPAKTEFEPVSGSKISATSATGAHKVDATVGTASSEIKLTSIKNKTMYLSVQGQMISR